MMDYAQFTLPHSSLGMVSPFEVVNGYLPRTSFDWRTPPATSAKEALIQKSAKELATRMHGAIKKARECIAKAQEKSSKDVNRY